MIDDKKLLALARDSGGEYDDTIDGVLRAIKFLKKNDSPLHPVQIEALLLSAICAHKNETDTWDHSFPEVQHLTKAGIDKHTAERVVALFERVRDE